jgi:branched-chain amino acid transport system ATP-binding protein
MSTETQPVLRLEGASVRFGGICAVNEVSLDFSAGCTGLIGPNGAGKTTLLDSLSGLRALTAGKVRYGGVDVTARSANWLARRGVSRTFQRHQAFGRLTVAENVLVPLEWRARRRGLAGDLLGTPGRKRHQARMLEQVDRVVERCGLGHVRDEVAASLPIGQLRLLEFARAIVTSPRLLLLDEPTSGLGQRETAVLGAMVRDLVDRDATTVVLVEHDVEFVMGLCDRVVCLDQGTVLAEGEPEQIRSDPTVIKAYLGTDV